MSALFSGIVSRTARRHFTEADVKRQQASKLPARIELANQAPEFYGTEYVKAILLRFRNPIVENSDACLHVSFPIPHLIGGWFRTCMIPTFLSAPNSGHGPVPPFGGAANWRCPLSLQAIRLKI